MTEREAAALPLVIRRQLRASPERVFSAWTQPESLSRWMSPFAMAEARLDLRVGGAFRIVMQGPDREIAHTGEYLEIEPPHRLVFTWQSPYTGSVPSVVTVVLQADGEDTELTLTHERLPHDQVEPHRGGWGQILANLETFLDGSTAAIA